MEVRLNSAAGRTVYAQARAENKQEEASASTANRSARLRDEIMISPEGRAAAEAAETPVKEWDLDELDAIIRENAPALLEAAKALNAEKKLEIDVYYSEVDPGGKIAYQAFLDSISEQSKELEQAITDYYAAEHKINSSMPLGKALDYITLKYNDIWSNNPYFRSDMSPDERYMASRQERFLLTTGRIFTLADPYALASRGGCANFFETMETARQAAQAKREELLAEWLQAGNTLPE